MYPSFRQFCERLLRIPPDPGPPPGDEGSTRLFRAAPNFYKYLLFLWALKSGLALLTVAWVAIALTVASLALAREGHPAGLLLLLIPAAAGTLLVAGRLFALAVVRLDFEKRWYVVTDRSLRVREGVFAVREMTITFANIQNISISQGPIQRVLGIANLRVDTAGGGAVNEQKHAGPNLHTAFFRGIANAGEVRDLIQQRLRQLKDSGLGDHEELAARAAPRHARPALSTDFLAALHELHAEARALRTAVSRRRE